MLEQRPGRNKAAASREKSGERSITAEGTAGATPLKAVACSAGSRNSRQGSVAEQGGQI